MKAAPVHLHSLSRLMVEVSKSKSVLDVGAGGRRLGAHVSTCDIIARPNVDVVCDVCRRLPFPDQHFDLVVCTSVLEHVENDRLAIEELTRVTSIGGRIWIEIPFLYHYHVSDFGDRADYRRWTLEGGKRISHALRLLEWGHNVGPATALRLMASEVLALCVHSPRHEGPYYLARSLLSWLLYPVSWLDRFCMRSVHSHRVAGGFYLLFERME